MISFIKLIPSCFLGTLSNVAISVVFVGTGSGVGTYVLNLLKDDFPDVYRWVDSTLDTISSFIACTCFHSGYSLKHIDLCLVCGCIMIVFL